CMITGTGTVGARWVSPRVAVQNSKPGGMFPSAPVTAAMELAARGVRQERRGHRRAAGPDARRGAAGKRATAGMRSSSRLAMISSRLAALWRPFTGIGRTDSTASGADEPQAGGWDYAAHRSPFARYLHA